MLLKLFSHIFKMSRPHKRVKVVKKPIRSLVSDRQSLENLSREELIEKIMRLEMHNFDLRNILKKKKEVPSTQKRESKKQIDFDTAPKRHIFLKFYYLGWDYQGFVIQENTNNTIEDHVLDALKKCKLIESREKSNYQRCGRTDKGVSAFSQVISLDVRSRLPEPTLENVKDEYSYTSILNRILPKDIQCYAWCPVSSDKSARFNCTARMYKYYFPKGNLDIDLMLKGAKFLVGSHDFRNFCSMDVGNGVTEFIRDILFVDIRPCSFTRGESGYEMYEFVIKGNAFLQHQIRYIMMVLFLIGEGKESPEIVKRLLDVEENPCRPQYSLASPLPLNLFDVVQEDVDSNWIMDEEVLERVLKVLQNQWTECSVKCTMIKDMIENLEKQSTTPALENQPDSLFPNLPKNYTPLFERPTCSSLEEKIEHYLKKGKIQITNR